MITLFYATLYVIMMFITLLIIRKLVNEDRFMLSFLWPVMLPITLLYIFIERKSIKKAKELQRKEQEERTKKEIFRELDKYEITIIEQYLRTKKLKNLKK